VALQQVFGFPPGHFYSIDKPHFQQEVFMPRHIPNAALCLSLILATLPCPVLAKPVCVEAGGEGVILRNDVPSARVEAISRAKWAAVEQVAGVEVKSRTVVEDSALLDDIITTQVRGVVTSHRLLQEQKTVDSVKVRVEACVEPSQARDVVSPLALNSAVVVFVPARQLGGKQVRYNDTTSFNESLNNTLIRKGFIVRDLAGGPGVKAADVDRALKEGDFIALRSLAYRYQSNTVLIGRIEPAISTKRGEDVGYGVSMPFTKVTVRLTYRLLTRDGHGELSIVAAGSEEAAGLAPAPEDAQAVALKNLSELAVPVIMAKIDQRMNDLAHKISVTIDGIKTPEKSFTARDMLQRITWVGTVEDAGLGQFRVSYPENPLYLANGLIQRGYKIINYSREAIRVRHQ